MEAATLNCPMCGAASASDAAQCAYCGARLATVACPSCFGMIFVGAKFCQHCGAKVERTGGADAAPKPCPRCRCCLEAVALGAAHVHECPRCEGLWVDTETFNTICSDREKQAAVIAGTPVPEADPDDCRVESVRYIPCAVCGTLMNRVNFAHLSGVILDICKPHGVWCDRDELRRIVVFIRAGGLEASRDRDRNEWEMERRHNELHPSPPSLPFLGADSEPTRHGGLMGVIETIGDIVWRFLR